MLGDGGMPKLTIEQKNELAQVVRGGAVAAGFSTDLWTLPRVAEVIRDLFGASLRISNVSRLLHALCFNRQKPIVRASERDDEAIARLVANQKKACRHRATIVFFDETGFMRRPLISKTWASRGETLVLRVSARHDRLSALGSVTL